MNPTTRQPAIETIAFVSLGCPKNLVDSEKMLGLLAEDGLIPVSQVEHADAVVINTCGFLEAAKDESLEVIAEAAERKRAGELRRIVVAGCLVQRHRAKLLDWCPEVDAIIGVYDRDRIVEAVRGGQTPAAEQTGPVSLPVYSSIAGSATLARRTRGIDDDGHRGYHESDAGRLRLTPRHYAYLRMSEGCNQNCAFCTIPSIRGKMRSKTTDALLAEARELMSDGAFELNLIGQDTTSYGEDIGFAPGLAGLLRQLNDAAGEFGGAWLRLMYAYPSCFTDEMIHAIADLPHVMPYIDMPLQHISDRVLDSMRRHTSRRLIETLLEKLRRGVPGIAIRTTFITGYPGETDVEHEELVRFLREFRFENMGVFRYSPEPGTPAGRMHDDGDAVPADVIEARYDELMRTQQEIVFQRNAELARRNAEFDVLIDDPADDASDENDPHTYVGRTYQQAPEIDTVTYVQSGRELSPGELVRCAVIDNDDYDLIARPAEETAGRVSLPIAGQ